MSAAIVWLCVLFIKLHQMLGTNGISLVPVPFTSKFVKVTSCIPISDRRLSDALLGKHNLKLIAKGKESGLSAGYCLSPLHSSVICSSGRRISHSPKATAHGRNCACAAAGGDQLRALILDCDGTVKPNFQSQRCAMLSDFADHITATLSEYLQQKRVALCRCYCRI